MTNMLPIPTGKPREQFFVLPDGSRTPVDVGDCFDLAYWSMFHPARRRIAKTRIGNHFVSTVFWGLAEHGPDKLFETMVFCGDPNVKGQLRQGTGRLAQRELGRRRMPAPTRHPMAARAARHGRNLEHAGLGFGHSAARSGPKVTTTNAL